MVNPKELMLNNYVSWFGMNYKVSSINDEFVDLEYTDKYPGYHPEDVFCERINPIPLTEDWLLNSNLERTGNLATKIWFKIGNLFLRNLDGEFDIFIEDVFVKKISYVHQLQNLYYSLVGEELQISA